MVTLELVEEFATKGWQVDVFTNYLHDPFAKEFEDLKARGAVVSDDPDDFAAHAYDLIWVHHAVLPVTVLERFQYGEKTPPIIWNHMSTMPGIESPILADIEASAAAQSLHNSVETMNEMLSYGLPHARSSVWPNPAPRQFLADLKCDSASQRLTSILVVSNHPPQELEDALRIIEAEGVQVVRIGQERASRVTPAVFGEVDAVVTIGKSVQYALCLGVPAYVYDHFGGPGWLTAENFENAASHNFSGRPERRRLTSEELAHEVLGGYALARRFTAESLTQNKDRFGLEQLVDTLLKKVLEEKPRPPLSSAQARRWSAFARTQRDNTRAVQSAWENIAGLEARLDHLASLSSQNAELTEQVSEIRASRSFRLGNALMRPFQGLRRR